MDRILEQLKESWGMIEFEEKIYESGLPPGFDKSDTVSIATDLGEPLPSTNQNQKQNQENGTDHNDTNHNEDMQDMQDMYENIKIGIKELNVDTDIETAMTGGKVSSADIENIIGSKVDLDAIKRDGLDPVEILKYIQILGRYNNKKYRDRTGLSKNDSKYEKIKSLLKKYQKQEKLPSGKNMPVALKRARDLHTSNVIKYVTYNIQDGKFNFDKLAEQAIIPPTKMLRQNNKMIHSATDDLVFFDTKIAAYRGLYFDKKEKVFKIVKTCPSAGTCTKDCYAAKGNEILFPSSNLNSIKTLTLLMNDYFDFKDQFISELGSQARSRTKKGKQIVVRWHSAGDFFTEKYFDIAIDIANECKNVDFYAYTKQIKLYVDKKSNIPENLSFILSEGGTEDALTRKLMAADPSLKKSIIVPNPPDPKDGLWDTEVLRQKLNDKEYYSKFKDFLSNEYNIDKNFIITYSQMVKIPYDKNKIPTTKYKVIVIPGDGDTAAYRKDVDVVLLLKH